MRSNLQRYGLAIVGVAVMVAALAWGAFGVDDDVPNDANIGAGLLLLIGLSVAVLGGIMAWSQRTPPPPDAE